MKKLITIITAAAGAATILAALFVATVSAHAPYSDSTPAKGAVVQTAPTSVVINFEENIQKTAGSYGVTVMKDGGGSATNGAATVSGDKQLTVPLQAGLTSGRFVVNWNNTAADDGDPLSGAFSFYIGAQPTSAQLASDAQLAAVESNQLATATAEAAQSTPSAATTPAAASTPAAAASPATSTLPRTGDGGSGSAGSYTLLALIAGALLLGGTLATAVAIRARRTG